VRDALEVFARQKHLAAIDVSAYNPAKDSDGSGAKRIVDLLAGVFQKRLEALQESAPAPAPVAAVAAAEAPAPEPVAGEAWSPDSLAETSDSAETSSEEPAGPDESASQ